MEVIQPNLTFYQKDILFSKARFTVTEASTKAGKTYSHIIWLYGKAHEHESALGRNYWWVAPVYYQAEIAFKRLKKYLTPTGLYRFNNSSFVIYCPNGAEIHFRSADNPDNLYGEDVYGAVFDEASRAKVESWYALRSTLTSTQAPCKLIGNFKGMSNWLHKLKELCYRDDAYEYFKVTCWDAVKAGILSEDEVMQAKADLPDRIFKELYEVEAVEDKDQLIQVESILKLFKGINKVSKGIKYITADIARMGKDKTVVFVWDDMSVVDVKELSTSSVKESVTLIQKLSAQYNVNRDNIIVDEDGVGGGVKDYLYCKGFINGSKPVKESGEKLGFMNLKTQCYWRLAEYINANKLSFDVDDRELRTNLSEELEYVRLAKEIDTTKIQLLGKDKIKRELGRSPDYSDSLMMRMYFVLNSGAYMVY